MQRKRNQIAPSLDALPSLLFLLLLLTSCQFPFLTRASPCPASLTIAGSEYPFGTIKVDPTESVELPSNGSFPAYWAEGTNTNHVFILKPDAANSLLADPLAGKEVKVTWSNCNTTTFTLGEATKEAVDPAVVFDQCDSGITLISQNSSSNPGWVIRGELAGEEINAFPTPRRDEILAEISLLDTILSSDGITLQVKVDIANAGQSRFTIHPEDVSIILPNSVIYPIKIEPTLPTALAPGMTETFLLTFTRPTAPGAVLTVFDTKYELEGY